MKSSQGRFGRSSASPLSSPETASVRVGNLHLLFPDGFDRVAGPHSPPLRVLVKAVVPQTLSNILPLLQGPSVVELTEGGPSGADRYGRHTAVARWVDQREGIGPTRGLSAPGA